MRVQGSRIKGFETRKGADCKLLIHSDTTDGSTTFADSSGQGHTVTQGAATCEHDTDQKKFGATSILFGGTNGFVNVADSAHLDLGASLFTIDFWIRMNALPPTGDSFDLFGRVVDGDNNVILKLSDSGGVAHSIIFTWKVGASTELNYAKSIGTPAMLSVNTWYHLAFMRGWANNANTYNFTINGIPLGTVVDSSTLSDLAAALKIGDTITGNNFDGWMDEFRLVKGSCMWTKPFVPLKVMYR